VPEQTITTLSREGRALIWFVWIALLLCALLFSLAVLSGERAALIPLATLPALALVAVRAGRMGISATRDALVIRNPLWTHRVAAVDVVEIGCSDEIVGSRHAVATPPTIFVKTEHRIVYSLLRASHEDVERVRSALHECGEALSV
jgi:hypothetical protein